LIALAVTDLETSADGAATVMVARSKTDQEDLGMVRYIVPDTRRHLDAWTGACSAASAGVVGWAERSMPVTWHGYSSVWRAAGVEAEMVAAISGHSSRVGAAQDIVRHGAELPAVMQAGGWKAAEMVSRYTRRLNARRSGAAKLTMLQNRV
jgi:hypothetical protein